MISGDGEGLPETGNTVSAYSYSGKFPRTKIDHFKTSVNLKYSLVCLHKSQDLEPKLVRIWSGKSGFWAPWDEWSP